MSEETVKTIVLTETLMRKRFLKFVSDIEKSLVSTLNSYAGTDKNTRFLHKNRDQPVTCRFVDEHGVNLPFCLFFTPEDNYLGCPSVYYPVGESPTYRPREKICDFTPDIPRRNADGSGSLRTREGIFGVQKIARTFLIYQGRGQQVGTSLFLSLSNTRK
jgi:hypothetical protein